MVRCVAEVSPRKLRELKTATAIVEKELGNLGAQQYFAAIINNTHYDVPAGDELKRSLSTILGVKESLFKLQILSNLATGVSEGRRMYGKMAAIVPPQTMQEELTEILARSKTVCQDFAAACPEYTRLLLLLDDLPRRKTYAAVIRAVRTEDFMTADALQVPLKTLRALSSQILRSCRSTSSVYYDLTPKPPATIEFE
jgi:GMP synthase (glutamine-hydrolysing)